MSGVDAGRCGNDDAVNIATFPVEERDDGWVYVKLPPVEELDGVLGTSKWKIRKDETSDPFTKLDNKIKAMKGRKGLAATCLENGKREIASAAAANGIDW